MMRRVFMLFVEPISITFSTFQKDYENVKTYRLEQNYRSTKNIVEAANSIIDKNKTKLDKSRLDSQ